jgi:O-antigen/teichoic acid export membrane protein
MIRWRGASRAHPSAESKSGEGSGAEQTLKGAGPIRNTLSGLLNRGTTAAFTAVLTVYLARAIGESGYATFALALSIGAVALLTSDAGISHSAARYIAERHEDRAAVADVAAIALKLNVVAALLSAGALWFLAPTIANAFGKHALLWPLRGIALAVVGQSMLLVYLGVFTAVRRIQIGVGVVFIESLVETTASIALVALGAGVTGAAFGRAIGYAVGAVAALAAAMRLLGRRAFSLRSRGETRVRDVAQYAGTLMVTNSAFTIYAVIDSLLIAAMLTTNDVGLFSAPMRLMVVVGYVGESVAGALGPRVARSAGHEPDAVTWNAGVRWLVIFQSLLLAPVLVWAQPIIVLILGQGFLASGPVLQLLTLYVFLCGLSPVMAISVNYLGEGAKRIPIVLTALAVNIILDVVLLPLLGVIGAAIGTSVAYAIYVPLHFRLCRKAFSVPLRPLLRTAARSMLGAAAMAFVLLAVGTSHLSVLQWVVGLLGGAVAFAAVLFATREVTPADVRGLVGLVRRRTAPA